MGIELSSRPGLPGTNPNEDLETASRNKLLLIFDTIRFEVRPEPLRDKGIDLIVELKHNNCYTNFRFAIQLKSTNSVKPNKDGSITFPVAVSNINYLLNYAMPAYYILYDHKTEQFYVEQADQVYHSLTRKYQNKKLPKAFKVRFSKNLNAQMISEIYTRTMEKGTLLARLNSHYNLSPFNQNRTSGIVIDNNNEVYSVDQNMAFIDQFGFSLLNQNAYTRIIEIEQRTHPRAKASSTFNLVCGVAYFQQSNPFKAIELLKLAEQSANEFRPEIRSMLGYTLQNAKYLIGMLSEQDFKSETNRIMNSENVGSFLKLENAYRSLANNDGNAKTKLKSFYRETERIIAEESENKSLLLVAYAHVLEAEAKILLNDLTNNMVLICLKTNDLRETKIYKQWMVKEAEYSSRLNRLMEFAFSENSFLGMNNLLLEKVEWLYNKAFISFIFSGWNRANLAIVGAPNTDDLASITKIIALIDEAVKSYELLGHTENLISALMLKYELLLFVDQKIEAQSISQRIYDLIEHNDFNSLRKRYTNLINDGPKFRRFINDLVERVTRVYDVMKASGYEDFILSDASEDMHSAFEKDTVWSIETFLDFKLP